MIDHIINKSRLITCSLNILKCQIIGVKDNNDSSKIFLNGMFHVLRKLFTLKNIINFICLI